MLKKIAVVCCLVMLLSSAVFAGPAKGKIVVTAPLIVAHGVVGLSVDNYSFGDDGFMTVFGTGQGQLTPEGPAMYGSPWSFGYCVTDNLEVGLNIGFLKSMGSTKDPVINLGVYGSYYLSTGKLMPFVRLGFTRVDLKDDMMGSHTLINSSIGLACALSKTVSPYLSIDFNTWVDTGTVVDLTFGFKFML